MLRKLLSSLFKEPERSAQEPHRLYWMHQTAKFRAIFKEAEQWPNLTILAWFRDTLDTLKRESPSASLRIEDASTYLSNPGSMAGETVIIADIYPLFDKEMQLLNVLYRAGVAQVQIHVALDEALFDQLGGERIIDILDTLGMKEDESIQHRLIDKAMERGRGHIASKLHGPERVCDTLDEWLKENIKS